MNVLDLKKFVVYMRFVRTNLQDSIVNVRKATLGSQMLVLHANRFVLYALIS